MQHNMEILLLKRHWSTCLTDQKKPCSTFMPSPPPYTTYSKYIGRLYYRHLLQNDATILDYVTQYDGTKSTVHRGTKRGYLNVQTPEPCPFDLHLILSLYFFFQKCRKNCNWWFDYVLRKIWLDFIL